jgi:hypothetical protein
MDRSGRDQDSKGPWIVGGAIVAAALFISAALIIIDEGSQEPDGGSSSPGPGKSPAVPDLPEGFPLAESPEEAAREFALAWRDADGVAANFYGTSRAIRQLNRLVRRYAPSGTLRGEPSYVGCGTGSCRVTLDSAGEYEFWFRQSSQSGGGFQIYRVSLPRG